MRRILWLGLATGALAGVLSAPPAGAAQAACLVVNTTSNVRYSSLGAAQAGVTTGDTLTVKGTCVGSTTIYTSQTLQGEGTHATLDGGSPPRRGSVLSISGAVTVSIRHLAITHAFNNGLGGGISNDGGTVTLTNSTISNNTSVYGGGIWSNGTVTLIDSTISHNTAFRGGGIFNDGGTVRLTNSTVSDNTRDQIVP
jgi:hypothetical protein